MNQPKKAANSVDLPSVNLLGTNAYGEPSVESGNMLNLRVSSDNEYIILIRDTSSGEVFTKQHGCPKKNQPIYPGSFVLIEKQLDPSQLIRNLTLECWVRPFDSSIRSQGLITQYSHLKKGAHEQCGVGLFLENQVPAFYVGDGLDFDVAYRIEGGFDFSSLTIGQWHHIVGVCAEGKMQLWCDGQKSDIVAQAPDDAKAGTAPLMLGRFGELNNNRCLDGDLAMPVIYARALGNDEVLGRFNNCARAVPQLGTDILACWPLREETGADIHDASANGRHGQIINHATWMIGGPQFVGEHKRFSYPSGYKFTDKRQDASRGHALRFASDDIYDCGWEVTDSVFIPASAPAGIYKAEICAADNVTLLTDVTFLVKRSSQKPRPRMLVLCAMNTWRAYNNQKFKLGPQSPSTLNTSFYEDHAFQQPTYYTGLNVPCPGVGNARRDHAEIDFQAWLAANSYQFDVAPDMDFEKSNLLDGYQIVVICGHSEYWSAEMYRQMQAFLAGGGHALVIAGNVGFWRVSFNLDLSVMECRKTMLAMRNLDQQKEQFNWTGARQNCWPEKEGYHSDDGYPGGFMRYCGYPLWKLFGMECTAFGGRLPACEIPATAARNHFLFNGIPSEVSILIPAQTEAIVDEWDTRINLPVQETAHEGLDQIPDTASSPNMLTVAEAQRTEETVYVWNYNLELDNERYAPLKHKHTPISQIIYFEIGFPARRVLYAGSIVAGSALQSNGPWSTMVKNFLNKCLNDE